MPAIQLRLGAFSAALAVLAATSSGALAQKKYDTGATDTEIKIGNIMPYSGPASAYGVIGKTEDAYFKKINAEGGINGRKINFITYDDGYSPPKTVEQARKLVESDEVLFIFKSLGTPPNSAIQKYMNAKKVPQLFVATGATKWNDPKDFPWTMGWQPNYQSEARIYAKYILKDKPNAKIAVLYQNDDYGKDYLKGLKDGLGAKAATMIVAEESYETTEPTIDSHIVKLKATGADVFFNVTTPKFAAQAIKKIAEIGWKPLHFLNNVSRLDRRRDEAGRLRERAGHHLVRLPQGSDRSAVEGRCRHEGIGRVPGQVLPGRQPGRRLGDVRLHRRARPGACAEACGDNLTRENVMKQAASIKDLELGGLLPGIKVNTSATDFAPIAQLQMMQIQGRDVGAVRRHHQRRRRRLTDAWRDVRPLTTKEAAPATASQGLFLDARRQMVFDRRHKLIGKQRS